MTKTELAKKARHFLEQTLQKDSLIVRGAETVSSPAITGMPKGSPNGNSSEDTMLRAATAQREIEGISDTIELLTGDEIGILQYRYLEGKSTTETARLFCVSRRQLNNLERRALVHFAYAYAGGVLLEESVVA